MSVACTLFAVVFSIGGCGQAVKIPKADAEKIAQMAIELYDLDKDGAIGGKELEAAASVASAIVELDSDGDGKVVADDISYAVNSWNESGTQVGMANCIVTKSGKPLKGATVTFEPEPFHEGTLGTVSGVCGSDGSVKLVCDELAATGLEGIPTGFYKVRITHQVGGKESIPAKYNTETTLGQAISPNQRSTNIDFRL